MNIETNTPQGDGAPAPGDQQQPQQQPTQTQEPAPKSDAEAALQAAEAKKNEQPKPGDGKEPDKGKNRTKVFIDSLKGENRELRQRLQSIEARLPKEPDKAEKPRPKLEDFDNFEDHAEAVTRWAIEQDRASQSKTQADTAEQQKVRDTMASYETKVAAFAEKHDDFFEAVTAMEYTLAPEIQLAIMGHDLGPDIAYYLANNDDEAFNMSNVLPQNADAAVKRLVVRMNAAQKSDTPPAPGDDENKGNNNLAPKPGAGAPAAPQPPPKPISQAPSPPPTVSGRSATETPEEKLTDDEWLKREQDKKRKRA